MDIESIFQKPGLIIGGVVLILGATGAFVATTSIQESRAASANDLLFQARKSLETEQKALVASVPKPLASPAPQEKPSAKGDETAEFVKTDVPSKFSDSLKKFQAVITDYPSTRAAFEARFAVGSLYYDHGDAVHAQEWFQQAADHAPQSADRAFALQSVGYSLENQGKKADAAAMFKKALDQNNPGLKSDLEASIARCNGSPISSTEMNKEMSNKMSNLE